MTLATTVDVAAAVGHELSDEETARADQLLQVASSAVQEKTGYRFEPGSYTVGRKVRRNRIDLPAKVAEVTAVRSVDECTGTATAVTDYALRGSRLYVPGQCYVEVDFTVTDAVPDEITALVAGVVGGLLMMPPAGVTSEMAGPYQVTFGNNSGRIYFSDSDMTVLRKYMQPKAAIRTL